MGLALPIHPYYAAQGQNESNKENAYNRRNRAIITELEDFIEQSRVKKQARYIITNGVADSHRWVMETTFEEDTVNRPALRDLIKKVGRDGGIVVPSVSHIIGFGSKTLDKDAIDVVVHIVFEPIQVIALEFEGCDLLEPIRKGAAHRFFERAGTNALRTRERLQRYLQGRGVQKIP